MLPVLLLLQVSDRPALHGRAGLPLLLSGVQKENHALDGLAPSASGGSGGTGTGRASGK